MSDSRTRSRADRRRAKEERARGQASARARSEDRRDPGLPGSELLVLRPRASGCSSTSASLEHWPSNTIPGFNDGLLELLPGARGALVLARPARRVRRAAEGRHVARPRRRARRARAPARDRRAHLPGQDPERRRARPLQRDLRLRGGAGRPRRRASSPSGWSTTWSSPRTDFDFLAELERLIRLAERRAFGPSTQAIIDEAASRDIPWIRLNEASLVQLGQGKYQQRIRATMTSKTSARSRSTSPATRS